MLKIEKGIIVIIIRKCQGEKSCQLMIFRAGMDIQTH